MKHQAEGISLRGLPLSIQYLLFSFKAEKLGTCMMHPTLLEACLYWSLEGLLVAIISRNKTWTLEMDVPESAFMPRLVSDPGSRVVRLEQHPLRQRPAEEHVDGALPLHSPVSPSFAMQKLRTGKEGTNILWGWPQLCPALRLHAKLLQGWAGEVGAGSCGGQGGAGTEEEKVGGEGPLSSALLASS